MSMADAAAYFLGVVLTGASTVRAPQVLTDVR